MNEFQGSGTLGRLVAAIAHSPIVIPMAGSPPPVARDFADWCGRQADIDAVILSWIRAQVPSRAPASLS